MPETQWMTLRETADMMKTLPEQVTRMCEDGKLEYYMEDGRYFVSRESIDVFMQPPIGRPAPAIPASNGTTRRQYGRAPHGIEPLPESTTDSQGVNGPDEVDAAGGSAPEDDTVETPGRGDEGEETAEVAQPAEDLADADHEKSVEDLLEAAEDLLEAAEDAHTAEDAVRPQTAGHSEDDELQTTAHSEDDEVHVVQVDDAAPHDEVLSGENADPEPSNPDGEHAETAEAEEAEEAAETAEAAVDTGEPDVRAAEILADLRAALSRHAREHKAFCDEIAALADALESTLSRDGDKTSELTREISSLLARYTRR